MSDPDRTRGHIHPIRGNSVPPEPPVRRLAAILAADISGYSRLMEIDEEGTYARVMRQRRELIEPTIAGELCPNYRGYALVTCIRSQPIAIYKSPSFFDPR